MQGFFRIWKPLSFDWGSLDRPLVSPVSFSILTWIPQSVSMSVSDADERAGGCGLANCPVFEDPCSTQKLLLPRAVNMWLGLFILFIIFIKKWFFLVLKPEIVYESFPASRITALWRSPSFLFCLSLWKAIYQHPVFSLVNLHFQEMGSLNRWV